jgi:hypothetical protein
MPTVILVIVAAGLFSMPGCKSKAPSSSAQEVNTAQLASAATPTPPTSRIFNKLPFFAQAWRGVADENKLEEFSAQYNAAAKSIADKTNSISDPQLRTAAVSDSWNQIDRNTQATWKAEGRRNFAELQRNFFSENADKLFEIGRLGPSEPSNNNCFPQSHEGFKLLDGDGGDRLIELCHSDTSFLDGHIRLKLSLAALDDILRRFDSLHIADVQACIDGLFEHAGMSRNNAPAEATEEAQKSCMPESRQNLSVLAQGDLLRKQVTKVYVVDYQTETILANVPLSDVLGLASAGWAAPAMVGTR